jgi:hypothetical protein
MSAIKNADDLFKPADHETEAAYVEVHGKPISVDEIKKFFSKSDPYGQDKMFNDSMIELVEAGVLLACQCDGSVFFKLESLTNETVSKLQARLQTQVDVDKNIEGATTQTDEISWDRTKLESFKKSYENASEEAFRFEDEGKEHEFTKGYAKYLIEYLEQELEE